MRLVPPGLLHPRFPRLTLGGRTLVMGILNVTPDSFSGDGLVSRDVDAIVARGEELVKAGADILDVGGESTRPGAATVPADLELARVLPVVELLVARVDVPISIDTRKASVAEAALRAGATVVNDVSGLTFDSHLVRVAASGGAGLILGHWRERRPDDPPDLIEWIVAGLRESIMLATEAGVARTRLVVDPGLGFAKPPPWSFEVQRRLPELRARLGLPVLIGASRKSHIGRALGDAPIQARLEGSLAAAAVAASKGADMVRVHDVGPSAKAVRVADAIERGWWADREPEWTPVYFGLGANLGQHEASIATAADVLGRRPDVRVVRRASLWESDPVGVANQPSFLNTVVEAETSLPPSVLLGVVKDVEVELGRQARARWGPREIDVDILLYGESSVAQPGLTIPHPALWDRLFALGPLAELQPDLTGPEGVSIQERVRELAGAQRAHSLGW